jgi:hypothetical protein
MCLLTKELALHMSLPRKSINGFPVIEHAEFSQEVVTYRETEGRNINLGSIYNMGQLQIRVSKLICKVFQCIHLLPVQLLFDQNVIVDLSRVGSSEKKSQIMGILVIRLSEYRMSNANGMNQPLKHVTVLEEAHNILKRTSTEQQSESSNVLGEFVEMLSNAIAEKKGTHVNIYSLVTPLISI